jgi:hypothetical protein
VWVLPSRRRNDNFNFLTTRKPGNLVKLSNISIQTNILEVLSNSRWSQLSAAETFPGCRTVVKFLNKFFKPKFNKGVSGEEGIELVLFSDPLDLILEGFL